MGERTNVIDIPEFDRVLLGKSGNGACLLDVRNPVDAMRWRPEGPGIDLYANIPYLDFANDEGEAFKRVPDASQYYVLCAKGVSSNYVAGVLRERGLSAINIGNGMGAWAAFHRTVCVTDPSEGFTIHQFARPAKGCLSYLVVAGKQALLVDCTRFDDVYQSFVQQLGVRVVGVVDTHLHADHVSGGAKLAKEFDSPYHLADEDAQECALDRETIPRKFTLEDVNVNVLSLPVPGHTLGSTALWIGGRYLISGDTLLPDGVGRPDLGNRAREWTELLYDSVHDVLGKLDPQTRVLPAHVASSKQYDARGACVRTLGALLSMQPAGDRGAFLERVSGLVASNTQPPEYAAIRKVNLGDGTAGAIEELEIGVNRCALIAAEG
jgi:glyoxylase-like metal-dependent hydrolase (beta-lactamase superfamily II)/rhodanese-related sulfurtransferase